MEIYNERIRDLLDPDKDNLKIRELNGDIWLEGKATYKITTQIVRPHTNHESLGGFAYILR